MGVGAGETGAQVHLHFSGGYGHEHADALDLLLYSHGKELLSDLGYTHTPLRPFASDSLAHNLVLVDGRSIRLPPAPSGVVLGVRRLEAGEAENALLVDTELRPRDGFDHERVVIELGPGATYGLAVDEIRRESGRSVIVLRHRPGFDLAEDGNGATQTHHPHRRFRGQPRFRMQNMGLLQ